MVFVSSSWRQKDLENKERKPTEIWHQKIVETNTPRGINITKWWKVWKSTIARRVRKGGQSDRNVCDRATTCCICKPCTSRESGKDLFYLLQEGCVRADLRYYLWICIKKQQQQQQQRHKRNSVNGMQAKLMGTDSHVNIST